MSDAITRKEYEERHTAIQLQLVALHQDTKSNTEAIASLTRLVADNSKQLTEIMTAVAVLKDRAKWLYPLLGIMGSIIAFLIGLHLPF